MKVLEKILVATDFTTAARDALATARATARVFKSRLIILHVMPVTPAEPQALATIETAVRQRLDELATETVAAGVAVEKTVLAHGSPFDQILQLADAEDVNVIIVGSEQKRPDDSFRLGVTPERLIRKADKPGSPPPPAPILCAVDFSDPSRRALTNAIHLARQFDAPLTVLHVFDTVRVGLVETPATAASDLAREQQSRQKEFDQFMAGFDLTGVQATARVVTGQRPRRFCPRCEWAGGGCWC